MAFLGAIGTNRSAFVGGTRPGVQTAGPRSISGTTYTYNISRYGKAAVAGQGTTTTSPPPAPAPPPTSDGPQVLIDQFNVEVLVGSGSSTADLIQFFVEVLAQPTTSNVHLAQQVIEALTFENAARLDQFNVEVLVDVPDAARAKVLQQVIEILSYECGNEALVPGPCTPPASWSMGNDYQNSTWDGTSLVYVSAQNEFWGTYFNSSSDKGIRRIGGTSFAALGNIAVPTGEFAPDQIVYDPVHNKVWGVVGNKVVRWDCATAVEDFRYAFASTYSLYTFGCTLALDPVTGTPWIAAEDSAGGGNTYIIKLNQATGAAAASYTTTSYTTSGASAMVVLPSGDCLFCERSNMNRVLRASVTTGLVTVEYTIASGHTVYNMAYDSARGALWILVAMDDPNSTSFAAINWEIRRVHLATHTVDVTVPSVVKYNAIFQFDTGRDLLWYDTRYPLITLFALCGDDGEIVHSGIETTASISPNAFVTTYAGNKVFFDSYDTDPGIGHYSWVSAGVYYASATGAVGPLDSDTGGLVEHTYGTGPYPEYRGPSYVDSPGKYWVNVGAPGVNNWPNKYVAARDVGGDLLGLPAFYIGSWFAPNPSNAYLLATPNTVYARYTTPSADNGSDVYNHVAYEALTSLTSYDCGLGPQPSASSCSLPTTTTTCGPSAMVVQQVVEVLDAISGTGTTSAKIAQQVLEVLEGPGGARVPLHGGFA